MHVHVGSSRCKGGFPYDGTVRQASLPRKQASLAVVRREQAPVAPHRDSSRREWPEHLGIARPACWPAERDGPQLALPVEVEVAQAFTRERGGGLTLGPCLRQATYSHLLDSRMSTS